jgi:hypothetical protein
VKFERLVIEAGPNTFSLLLHRRLTVIAGLGAEERKAVTSELIESLARGRPGVHVEVAQSSGRRLAVFRPEGAKHRVIDVGRPGGQDVTEEFMNQEGAIDLFGHHGLDPVRGKRMLRLTHADLQAGALGDEGVRRLAEVDQTQLWSAAARVRVTDDELTHQAGSLGATNIDDEVVARIERCNSRLEATDKRHRRPFAWATAITVVSLMVGLLITVFDPVRALPALSIGLVTAMAAIILQFQLWSAQRAMQAALAEAGAESYMTFQMERVDGLLSDENGRRRLLAAAETHRTAASRWAEIAGDVSVDWAMERHEEITATSRLRHDMHLIGSLGNAEPDHDDENVARLTRAIVCRLGAVRALGRGQEGFPLVLDEPFTGVEAATKPMLLELLSRTAGSPQIVLLTDDEAVASWARLEALSGELAILEPEPLRPEVGRAEKLRAAVASVPWR